MRIVVASGKGGTGKTTVATNLAHAAARKGQSVAYLDCDVEAPNGHIFLEPEISSRIPVCEMVPAVDAEKCMNCGTCSEICQYYAIVCIAEKVLVYPDLCHACGGCSLVCPAGAISELPHEIGVVQVGRSGPLQFVSGELHIGKVRAIPVIRAVKSNAPQAELSIVDAPAGTSCPLVESVRGTDFGVLVTDPTPFSLHDLKLTVQVMQQLDVPCGVVINRASLPNADVRSFCRKRAIPILGEIPDDRRLAEVYSHGQLVSEALPEYESMFERVLDAVTEQATAQLGRMPREVGNAGSRCH